MLQEQAKLMNVQLNAKELLQSLHSEQMILEVMDAMKGFASAYVLMNSMKIIVGLQLEELIVQLQ